MSEKISKKSVLSSYKMLIFLVIGIVVGCIIGAVFKEKAVVLKPLGQIFLNLMFTTVVPLVFFSLVTSIIKMSNMQRLGAILRRTILVFVVTGIISSIFIIIIMTIVPPAEGVTIALPEYQAPESFSFLTKFAEAITVSDFNLILSRNAMLPLIIFSLLLGYCIRLELNKRKEYVNVVVGFFDTMAEALMRLVNLIMVYAPIGLGAYFAALVGQYGQELIGAYSKAVIMFFPICIVYFLIFFTLYAFYAGGSDGVKVFYKNIFPSVVTSLATQSSIATLPTNLQVTEKMGVKEDIAAIILPMGATIHMDGTVLTTLLKIAFAFGVFGLKFQGLGVWVPAVILSVMAGVVMSGIPGGGMMGSLIIVGYYGFSPEIIPILVTIGMLTDPIATMINATGDAVSCMMVSKKVDSKDWLKKQIEEGNVTI